VRQPVFLLEVIVCSVADAIEAEKGGAGRLEIVRDLKRGGLTPSIRLVTDIIASVSLPVRVMVREKNEYEIEGAAEKQRLCLAAAEFAKLPIDGLVLGFLRKERIDVESTQQILEKAPNLKATFHHAFESAEPGTAISEIKKLMQIDRILAHGGDGEWPEKFHRLRRYQQIASPEIEIIAGGGLGLEKIRELAAVTEICEFHVGRAARTSGNVDGTVEAARVKTLVEAARFGPDINEADTSSARQCLR
jgi:copper homeostasis protein